MILSSVTSLLREKGGEHHPCGVIKQLETLTKKVYRERIEYGIYLSDVDFEDLTDEAKRSMFDEVYYLWINDFTTPENGKI